MLRHLLRYGGASLAAIGERILSKLMADPALVGACSALRAAQTALTARLSAHQSARQAAREAGARRDQAHRDLIDRLREVAFAVLSLARNNHAAHVYLRYFPKGYGNALRLGTERIGEFASILIRQLETEADPWLMLFCSRLIEARDAFISAQALCEEAERQERASFEYLRSEKRRWLVGLYRSRLQAQGARPGEPRIIRGIYEPAMQERRRAKPARLEPGDEAARLVEDPAEIPAAGGESGGLARVVHQPREGCSVGPVGAPGGATVGRLAEEGRPGYTRSTALQPALEILL
jgi:hypothetical protein